MAQNVEFLGALVVIVFLLPIFKMEYATDTYYMENHGFRHTYAPHSRQSHEGKHAITLSLQNKKDRYETCPFCLAWERGFEPPHREPGLHP